jgi:metallo-beta-lactamase family protein
MQEKKIPELKIFLDSPMASRITKVFENHPELFDEKMSKIVKQHKSLFDLPNVQLAGKAEESKAINNVKGSIMVIAGSGMCTGGRIKYHLINNITRPECTIMFVGYQAMGTLGRVIVDGAEEVRILGSKYPIKARIERIHGFSAHADRSELLKWLQGELLKWLQGLEKPPRKVFVVHGESESAKSFGDFVRTQTGWDVMVPAYQDEVVLS